MSDANQVSPCTYRAGCARSKYAIFMTAKVDNIEEDHGDDVWYSRNFVYDHSSKAWGHSDYDAWEIVSICATKPRPGNPGKLCSLSKDGDVAVVTGQARVVEHLPGAGLGEGDELGYGYVSRIREIGDHLYACGSFGQIYKRTDTEWIHIDAPFLSRDPLPTGDEERDVEALLEGLGEAPMFQDINGPSEEDVYVCGMNGVLAHWDGLAWSRLTKYTDAHLNEIHVASPDEIWICGTKGLVLKGNARDGFEKIIASREGRPFNSIHKFLDKVYLADYDRLYTLEVDQGTGKPEARPIIPMFGLAPPLQDANMLDSCEGALWSIGLKDLAFSEDGKRWTRVEHPDNPKIGWI